MRIKDLFENWGLNAIKIKGPFWELDWTPDEPDMDAAWDLYVELLTRVTTQALPPGTGDEKAALDSIYSLFPSTRGVLRHHGRKAQKFTKIAIVVLNQIVRPFTSRWHERSLAGAFERKEDCSTFRSELVILQQQLEGYCRVLAEVAGVEDLTREGA